MEKRFAHIYVKRKSPKEGTVETFDLQKSTSNIAMMIFISATMKAEDCELDYEISFSENPSKAWDSSIRSFR